MMRKRDVSRKVSNIELRQAGHVDLPTIGRINHIGIIDSYPLFLPTFKPDDVSIESRTAVLGEWFTSDESSRCILMVYEDDHPIGFSACCLQEFMGFQAYLRSFHVLPERRRRGIGRKLFDGTVEWLAQMKVDSLFLEAYRANPFLRFYKKMGGKVVKEMKQYKYGSNMDVVVYGWPDLCRLIKRSENSCARAN